MGGGANANANANANATASWSRFGEDERRRLENRMVAVEVALGVTLGIVLIAGVVGGLWWIRRVKRRAGGVEVGSQKMRNGGGGEKRVEGSGHDTWSEAEGNMIVEKEGEGKWVEMP